MNMHSKKIRDTNLSNFRIISVPEKKFKHI